MPAALKLSEAEPAGAPAIAPERDSVLLALLAIGAWVRLFRLGAPAGALIFDEAYYVQSARVILGWSVTVMHLPARVFAGLDPNSEHPPLAKAIIAGSLYLFGDRGIAWRLPSVILGVLSIWLIYRIALKLNGDKAAARIAAFVLAFDNLSFVHGRIATLDVYVTTFLLLGALLYLSDRHALSGVAFGLAIVCKINGAFGPAAIVCYGLGRCAIARRLPDRSDLKPLLTMALFFLAFSVCALGALDGAFTSFRSPLAHVAHILRVGASLCSHGDSRGIDSTPLHWWLNETPIQYLVVNTRAGEITRTAVLFRGALTSFVMLAAPFALLNALLGAVRGSRLGLFAFAWFAANYLPLLAAWLVASRLTYLYYMLPPLPGIALAIGLGLSALPRSMRWCFVGTVLYSFALWFPFRWY